MLLLNMTRVKSPMTGLPSRHATASLFDAASGADLSIERNRQIVLLNKSTFETARASTTDHADTHSWARQLSCGGTKCGETGVVPRLHPIYHRRVLDRDDLDLRAGVWGALGETRIEN